MRYTTTVLVLGEEQWGQTIRQKLPHWQKRFVLVPDIWHLCALPQSVQASAAAFHRSFPHGDLRYAAEYLRRRWPDVAILVAGEQATQLDDPLYDDVTAPNISPEELAHVIEKLVQSRRRSKNLERPFLGGARR